jgi:beta-phosphoglucomutase
MITGCIFDLDGVIVDTAKFHFLSWQNIAKDLGVRFTEKDNEKLKGVSRQKSLEHILTIGKIELSQENKDQICKKKNDIYLEYLSKMDNSVILPGVINLLDVLQENKLKIALGSASKNARTVLNYLKIDHYFEIIVDGNDVINSKPDPEVFLKGAKGLGIAPENLVVFEDSEKGIDAAIEGGFHTIGVGTDPSLFHAQLMIPSFAGISILDILKTLSSLNEKPV